MSIQEKKSNKGTPYAIVKFSDHIGEFEIFLFAEMLINNRDKLKESESFVLTLQKDNSINDKSKQRINLKKLVSLDEMINKPYTKVTIEVNENFNADELKALFNKSGETKIDLIIISNKRKVYYSFQNKRKFDFNNLKALKSKNYVTKITV